MANRVVVKPHAELVSIRSARKGGKPHHMGACMLKNVTVMHDGLQGDLLEEWTEVRELGADALKHLKKVTRTDKGFVFDGTDKTLTGDMFRAAYVCGPEFYVSA